MDYYLPDLDIILEYDGKQHYEYVEHYHCGDINNYYEQIRRDELLENYCKEHGIRLIRIPYVDNDRLEEVILEFLNNGNDITTKIIPKIYT